MRLRRCYPQGLALAAAITVQAHAQALAQTPAPVFLKHPIVTDTAHLKSGDTVVALAGLQGWAGDPARELQAVITQAGDAVTCQPQAGGTYACKLPNGGDVAELALALGDAKALDGAPPLYRTQQAAAEAAHRGVWAAQVAAPAVLHHPVVQTTADIADNGRQYPLDGLNGFPAPFYTLQLQRFIDSHGGALSCTERAGSGRYVCRTQEGTDIATVALLEGLARVSADAPAEYRADQDQAARDKSGFWFNPPQQVVAQVASQPQPQPLACCTILPENSQPVLSYDDGIPVVVIGDFPAYFIFIREIGWGYYDHVGGWHAAPAAYRAELARRFPNGPAEQAATPLPAGPLPRGLRTTPAGFRDFGVRAAPGALLGQPALTAQTRAFRPRSPTPLTLFRPTPAIGIPRPGRIEFERLPAAVRRPAFAPPGR